MGWLLTVSFNCQASSFQYFIISYFLSVPVINQSLHSFFIYLFLHSSTHLFSLLHILYRIFFSLFQSTFPPSFHSSNILSLSCCFLFLLNVLFFISVLQCNLLYVSSIIPSLLLSFSFILLFFTQVIPFSPFYARSSPFLFLSFIPLPILSWILSI